MHPRNSWVAAFSLLLCIAQGQPAGAATQDALAFDRGVAAFQAGDYDAALESFLQAQRAGLDTPGLHYNLGATYYRLRRYPEAEREFQALARDPAWRALATYNLGLIAQRMERPGLAKERFELALRTATDPKLRMLAAAALGRLESVSPTRVVVLASLAAGYDSNATLTPDAATAGTSHQGDLFAESLGAASYRLGGNAAGGTYAQAGFLVRKYQDLNQFDQAGLRLGLGHETDSGRWQTSVDGFFDLTYFGGDLFQRAAVLDAGLRRRLGSSGDLRGRYEFQRIEGGAGFEYLDGWQQQLSVDWGFLLASSVARIGYQLELNNRRDLQQGADFLSYSPTRNSVYAGVIWPNIAGWSAEARGEYRFSRYPDPYVLDNGTLEVKREDKRLGIELRGYRRLAGPWRVFADYSYYRNDSTVDTYDYTRYQVLAGIEVVFEK
jgi:tetratricopeptide (TPR) repeat protein